MIITKRVKSQPNEGYNFNDYKVLSSGKYKNTSHSFSLGPKPEQKNFVYCRLKNQKIITTLLSRLFKRPKVKTIIDDMEDSRLFQTRAKTQMSTHSKQSQSSSFRIKDVDRVKGKVQTFNSQIKKYHKSMNVNKQRFNILNRYNKEMNSFYSKIPVDISEQTRQSLQQNQKLIKICIEDSLARSNKQHIQNRYDEIMNYSQPTIPHDLKKEFAKRKKRSEIRELMKKKSNKFSDLAESQIFIESNLL